MNITEHILTWNP